MAAIFLRPGIAAQTEKNAGIALRRALATTSSEGGIAGFMVRSQLRKEMPDVSGVIDGEVLQQSLGDASELDVDVIGAQLAVHGVAIGVRGSMQILIAAAAAYRLHIDHLEVIGVGVKDMNGLPKAEFDLESVAVELKNL